MLIKKFIFGFAFFGAVLGSQAANAVVITNGGFESPALISNPSLSPTELRPQNNYSYPGYYGTALIDGWSYTAGAGLVDTSQGYNAWYGNTPPANYEGNQFAFLQGGAASVLSQTFFSATAQTVSINWLEAGRPYFGCCNGDQTYLVELNGKQIGKFSSSSGQIFELESVRTALVAGYNTLSFIGATPANLNPQDQTVFLDAVSVTSAVPEASTWAMMIIGFVGIGYLAYRRQGRPSLRAA